jgi:hypothetical protein
VNEKPPPMADLYFDPIDGTWTTSRDQLRKSLKNAGFADVLFEGDMDIIDFYRRLPRPSPVGKDLVILDEPIRRQRYLHLVGWTALDDTVEVSMGNDTPLWDDTEIALGWSPPSRGPQERAWLITEKNRKGRGPDGRFLPKEMRS